ncbi:LytR C-terminal domain-containing protein [Saccharomonospora piscinae]|uniref:LytR C-terminal domain-containing protein n=1 Tax=Saccharomonospora piscinae TaxID=687388 RepID=UPI000466F975|nr:LytR C-terminal domain-containing protein [Saccharomonospora piscinae]
MSILDGVSRPLRATGLGLLAVAVVAAAVGGVTLVSGGDSGNPDNAAASSSAPPPDEGEDSRPDGEPSSSPQAPSGSSEPGQPDGGDRPGDGDADDPDGDGSDGTDEPGGTDGGSDSDPGTGDGRDQPVSDDTGVAVRVYNNSNIGGLASEASGDLRAEGWDVVETGNYSAGVIPETTVYFRPGTDEESAARSLADSFGMRVEPRFDGIADASPGVIVIVARDYENPHGK